MHAIVLTGGSAFGLDAAGGVVDPRTGGATTIGVIAAAAVTATAVRCAVLQAEGISGPGLTTLLAARDLLA